MRQIGTLADGNEARALADYLLTQQIETQLLPDGDGWAVWVRDEDRVAQARQEFAAFQANPADPRYAAAARTARELRQREDEAEEAYRRRQVDLRERLDRPAVPRLTLALALVSVGVSLGAGTALLHLTEDRVDLTNPVLDAVLIQSPQDYNARGPGLHEVAAGQVWRLLTPIFLHFGPIHLLFNLMMLRDLGAAVESRRGTWRFLLLVLVLAVASNLAQYEVGWRRAFGGEGSGPSPLFGGLSGVLFGLFGYVWMKGRYAPELGLGARPDVVVWMMGWFFLCWFGVIGHVANTAHAAGLLLGMAIGVAPHLFRRTPE